MKELGALFLILVVLVVAGGIYFIPAIVATMNRHRNRGAIFVINLLAGWTLIGWVAALAWAVMAGQSEPPSPPAPPAPPRELEVATALHRKNPSLSIYDQGD